MASPGSMIFGVAVSTVKHHISRRLELFEMLEMHYRSLTNF
jgi:hypothetical protein